MTTTELTVTPGYKPSPVGPIPEDWERYELSKICEKILDGTHFSPKTTSGPYKYITSKNIRNEGLDLTNCLYISEKEHREIYKRCPVQLGDVLLTKDGAGTGNCCINTLDEEFSILSSVAVLRGAKGKLTNSYLLQLLQSPRGQAEIKAVIAGQAITRITLEKINNFIFTLPPLPEQQKIAEVLSTWDTAIERVQALVSALQTRHRGLLQQLLTSQKRLPGFTDEWQEVKLGEVFERITRRNSIGNTNVLTISAQAGLISQVDYFNRSVASEEVSNYYLIHNGEYAYNKSYSVGYAYGAIKRLDFYDKGILSPLYICMSLKKGYSDFFPHFFEAGGLNHGIYKIAQEGARNHGLLNIGVGDFFDIKIAVPTLDEQAAIARVLDASLAEVRLYEQRLAVLKTQKRGLMQRLLTGQVRVAV